MIRFPKSPALPVILACALLQLPATVRAESPDTATAASLFGDPVLATGKGFEIKRSQVDDAFINYNANAVASGHSIPEEQRATIRSNLLNRLIVNRILFLKATDEDKALAKKQVDDYITQLRTNAPSPEAFDEQIKATGMTLAQVRSRMEEDRVCNGIMEHEITNGIVVSDAEVKKFYDDNPDKFKMPERVRAAHILVSTQDPVTHQPIPPELKKEKLKLANELKARADKGEDFAALVKQYSDDPGSKSKGGEYTFPRGKMVPEFEAAAFSMKVNQISEPVETQFGYHIIKLLEKLPASTEDYAKAEPAIRDWLVEKQAEKGLPAYLDKLKLAANVKILDQSGTTSDANRGLPAVKQ
jgi:peptidyl-prolyl cis-trans isomerase C